MTITSEPFKLPRSVYERYVAVLWLERRWWAIAVPIVAAAVASIVLADARWLLVSLMYLFIVTPGIISMAYFKYLLTPEARLTAIEKQIAIVPGRSISISYIAKPGEDDEGGNDHAWLPPDEVIEWGEIKKIGISGSNYVLTLRNRRHPRFLLVPRRSLSAPLPPELLGLGSL